MTHWRAPPRVPPQFWCGVWTALAIAFAVVLIGAYVVWPAVFEAMP